MPTAKEYADAIRTSQAVIKNAAAKLKVSRQAVYDAIKKHATVRQAFEDSREETIDYVETKLMEQIADGNMTAIIFYLKTQAKSRGYIETDKQEHTGELAIRIIRE